MTRGRTAALVVGACLAAALAGPGAPAVSVPSTEARGNDRGAVALSVDGQTWAEDLQVPLFDPDRVWMPGDVERATVLVRHDGAGEARGRVMVSVDGDPALAEAIEVRVRAGQGTWRVGGTAPIAVGQDDAVPVELEVALAPDAGNATQGATVRLDIRVVLAGDDAGAAVPPGLGSSLLPRTGADLWLVLVLAAALTAVGVAVRCGVRREAGDG